MLGRVSPRTIGLTIAATLATLFVVNARGGGPNGTRQVINSRGGIARTDPFEATRAVIALGPDALIRQPLFGAQQLTPEGRVPRGSLGDTLLAQRREFLQASRGTLGRINPLL